jgi:hypothetical protein
VRVSSLSGAVALALFATTSASRAASVLQVRAGTGTSSSVAAGNDYPFLDEPFALVLDGILETTGAGTLTFEYLGFEAGWTNAFVVGGNSCFISGSSAVGATCSATTSGGSLDFQFRSNLGTADPDAATWNNLSPPGSLLSYSIGLVQEAPNAFLILWEDSDARDDDDHDDLGVRVVFEPAAAPERDTLGLMLAGLVGAAGFVRRRPRGA